MKALSPPSSLRILLLTALVPPLAAPAATSDYRSLILGDGPIVYFEFDESNYDEVNDITTTPNSAATGLTYTGTITGTVTFGQPGFSPLGGTAVEFEGGFITAASGITASMTEWSLEAWVNYSSDKLSDSHILSNDQSGWNDDVMFGINPENGLLGGGAGTIGAGQQDNASESRDFAAAAMSADTWHHVVVTASNSSNELLVYIDGELAASNTANANSIWSFNGVDGFGTAPLMIGAKRVTGGNSYLGLLDELVVYDSVLTPSQILSHFNAVATAPGTGSVSLTITPNGADYDFTWSSQTGKIYDLVSSTDLSTSPEAWPVWNEQSAIPSAGSTTTLIAIPTDGSSRRFFAVVERAP